MLIKKLKEISDYKAKLAALEEQVSAERGAAIQGLHLDLGFGTRAELIEALRDLEKRGVRAKPGPKKAAPKGAARKAGGKKRKRAKITPELRKAIIDSIKGGATGASVAKQHGVSLPTVQNIKRAAGLTRNS